MRCLREEGMSGSQKNEGINRVPCTHVQHREAFQHPSPPSPLASIPSPNCIHTVNGRSYSYRRRCHFGGLVVDDYIVVGISQRLQHVVSKDKY